MASGITYHGVTRTEGGDDGGIFQGLVFWLSRALPIRKDLIGMVQNNGGILVLQEKDADILIADDLRNDVPRKSYSYRFILDSVDKGIVQLRDKYRLGPASPRPAASPQRRRAHRTAFSAADDAILAQWIISHPELGTQGNQLYIELAEVNDRHTWQSWRNRFTKTFKQFSRKHLEALAATADELAEEQENQAQANTARPGPSRARARTRERPQETRPVDASRIEPIRTTKRVRERRQQEARVTPVTNNRQPRAKALSAMIIPEPKQAGEEHDDPEETNATGQCAVPKANATSEMGTLSNGDAGPRGIINTGDDAVSEHAEDDVVTVRDQFYSDLQSFVEDFHVDVELDFTIDGQKYEIWDLFFAVGSQKLSSEDVDWIKVAEDLGFEWFSSESVFDALQQCYEDNLAEFVDVMAGFAQEMEEAEQEIASEDEDPDEEFEKVVPAVSTARPPTQVDVSSPPPVATASKKRAWEEPTPSSWRTPKRRRLSHNLEIPATPGMDMPPPSSRRTVERNAHPGEASVEKALPLLRRARDEKRPGRELGDDAVVSSPALPSTPTRLLPTRETPYDITPSQQLHSEVNDIYAIPMEEEGEEGEEGGKEETERDGSITEDSSNQWVTETETSQDLEGDEAVVSTSPSTLKALPKKRVLPVSFKPPESPSPPKPQAQQQQFAQAENSNANDDDGDNRQRISHWVEHYESLGYPHLVVVKALDSTTMTPGGLAGMVMQSLKEGKGVPTHTEGIWTDRDDESLRLVDSVDTLKEASNPEEARKLKKAEREWNRIVRKHTMDRVELRRKFLDAGKGVGRS